MKIKNILFSIITFLVLIFNVIVCNPLPSKATTTATILLETNKNIIEQGEEIEITLKIENNFTAAYSSNLYFDSTKFEFISGPENINIQENCIISVWYDEQGGSGAKQGELAKFIFKAKEEGIGNFTIEGEFFSSQGQLIETNNQTIQVQVGQEETAFEKTAKEVENISTETSNANLQVLMINQEGLVPSFSADIYNYDITVSDDINKIEVLAIAENTNSQIEITGNEELKLGINTINIIVTSENGSNTNIYKIEVTKTEDIEAANTNLEILAIENSTLNPTFDNHVTTYTAEISNKIEEINILAVPENENGEVEVIGGEEIKEGNNKITVIVTAANGITKREYEVNIYKRNQQEEELYEKEQEENSEKLEEAYEIEKMSNENEDENSDIQENNGRTGKYLLLVGIISLIIGIIYYKKGYKRRER